MSPSNAGGADMAPDRHFLSVTLSEEELALAWAPPRFLRELAEDKVEWTQNSNPRLSLHRLRSRWVQRRRRQCSRSPRHRSQGGHHQRTCRQPWLGVARGRYQCDYYRSGAWIVNACSPQLAALSFGSNAQPFPLRSRSAVETSGLVNVALSTECSFGN